MNRALASKSSGYNVAPAAISISLNNNNNTHLQAKLKKQHSNMKPTPPQTPQQQQECHLDELGYCFVKKCIETIEARGLDDQGLYRIGGVNSRVARLLQMCLDRRNYNQTTGQVSMPDFSDPVEWETKTITSALKNYLRNLSEPLMTYNLHPSIIDAAKIENSETRTNRIRSLIQQLPDGNFTLLKTLVEHLKNVASHSDKNLMTVSNLGICFAPTLMRGPEESALSIMEIRYSNVVANTLIEEYDYIFNDPRMNNPQSQQNAPQQIHYTPQVHLDNRDEQYAIGLPIMKHQNHQLPITSNMMGNALLLPYYPYYPNQTPYRSDKAITLYACVADTESELSFGPYEYITDVRPSAEKGWLIGTLERNGHRGLLPENYVEFI